MKTFTFVNPYAVVILSVMGEDDWTEEQWEENARLNLEEIVFAPDSFGVDDVVED